VTRTKVLLYRGTRVRQDELRGVPLHVPGHPGRAGDRRARFEIRRGEHGVGEATPSCRAPERRGTARILREPDCALQNPALRALGPLVFEWAVMSLT